MPASTTTIKSQPWKAAWPPKSQPEYGKLECDDSKGGVAKECEFGFEKGDYMVFEGNVGNFLPRERWNVEQTSTRA